MRQAAQITMAHLQLGAEQAGLAEEAEMQTERVWAAVAQQLRRCSTQLNTNRHAGIELKVAR